jgi:hypothetical protein
MSIYQLVPIMIIAIAAGIAGYRLQKNAVACWLPELTLRVLWIIALSGIALLWSTQSPIPAGLAQTCSYLTAAYLPFWLGRRVAAFLVN